jgi:hypothetical protein
MSNVDRAPRADARGGGEYRARGSAAGPHLAAWIVGTVAALIALVHAIGAFA